MAAPPAWVAELTPTQKAALGWHPSGASGEMAADAALMSDGQRSWVSPAGQALSREERDAEERARHPSVFSRDPSTECLVDDMELYRWDTAGHIVLRGVMDEAWLAAARAAIASLPTTHTDRVPADHIHGSFFAGMAGGTAFELPPGGVPAVSGSAPAGATPQVPPATAAVSAYGHSGGGTSHLPRLLATEDF